MKYLIVAMVLAIPGKGWSQNLWSQEQINQAFQLMIEDPVEVESILGHWGVTPHDFGLDLLAQGRGGEALMWTEIAMENHLDTRTARAWSLGALGQVEEAFIQIDLILSDGSMLEQARALYISTLLSMRIGNKAAAREDIVQSQEIYRSLNFNMAVEACQAILDRLNESQKELGGPIVIGDPPPRTNLGL